ncbi:MAG TPA: RNA-directed DNA polymerase [Spirochaetota bacterium]|nr:RNA-directed DNA polymerase [Spirochaetota bacterium]
MREDIGSFNGDTGKGIPLGNVTSQVFANIYLNELDQFVFDELKTEYVRYADDFVILDYSEERIFENARKTKEFIEEKLSLKIPDKKTVFRKLKWGIDFCGSIVLPNAILLRHKTKARMLQNMEQVLKKYVEGEISESDFAKIINSYFGLLEYCNSYNLKEKIRSKYLYNTVFLAKNSSKYA